MFLKTLTSLCCLSRIIVCSDPCMHCWCFALSYKLVKVNFIGHHQIFWNVIIVNPNFHALFISRLLRKGDVQKWRFPCGFKPGVSCTTMHCPPLARHLGVAVQTAISCPCETCFYDVIRFSTFSLLSFVGFCWTLDG